MPKPKQIEAPKQLVVEGQDAAKFFEVLLRQRKLSGVQIQNYGGISELSAFLKALKATPGFQQVTSLAVVRDAEGDCRSAEQSVCSALSNANLPVPDKPIGLANATLRVSYFILPDCSSSGMLESLCLRAINGDPAMSCVGGYFECLGRQGVNIPESMMYKAKLHAFLASRQKPDLQLGEAADKGYLNLDNPAFDQLKHFLERF